MSKPVVLPEPWYRGRWTPLKKARVIDAILEGDISEQTACDWYAMTQEELDSWMRLYAAHGSKGLQTTKLRKYCG